MNEIPQTEAPSKLLVAQKVQSFRGQKGNRVEDFDQDFEFLLGLYKSDLALMGVLLVLLWGSTREDLEVRVGGGGGLGREE